jgi:hypothetical protein
MPLNNVDLYRIDGTVGSVSNIQTAAINGGPIGGSRNAIINGNPTINQRGYVSGTATSGANQYTLDRWKVVTSGQSITWTDSQNVRTVTAPAGGVEQVIEGVNLGTGTYTLSWTGTATATVGGSAVANGTTVSLTGGVNTAVRFSGGTFSLVQLEPGTKATPFEHRSYGLELHLCQRYFQSFGGVYNTTWGVSTYSAATSSQASFWFPATMRISPAFTTAGTGFTATDNNNGPFTATFTGGAFSPFNARLFYTHLTMNVGTVRMLTYSDTTSYLQFSAEL